MKPEHKKYTQNITQELNLKERISIVFIFLIIILGFSAYSNSLNGKFIWDDSMLVEDNLYIRSLSHIGEFFTGKTSTVKSTSFLFYRPLQMLTYTIDYSLWKLNVKGYHLVNILLHILVALAIYWLVNILYDDRLLSFLTGIFFVIHPIHTEAVTYISGRSDSLAGLFMLLCFVFYIKAYRAKKMSLYILTLLTYIAALLSRESSVIVLVLLLLYHYSSGRKIKLTQFSLLTGVTLIYYILLRFFILKELLPHFISTSTLFQRVPGFFVAITNYIRLILFPFHLHMEYGNKLFNLSNPQAIAGALILVFLLAYALRKRKDNKLIFFSISWFFIALLPVSNLYPVNAYMAEHWLYIPSIGVFLLLAKGLVYLYGRKEYRIAAIVIILGLLAFYSYLTIRQNDYWREPIAFYKRTLKYAPDSWKVYNNLGRAYYSIGQNQKAVIAYNKALEINPGHAKAYNNLGNAYTAIGKKEKAIIAYNRALELEPDYAEAYNNLGNTYASIGRRKEAIGAYKKALSLNPNYAKAYNNLGAAYSAMGNKQQAIAAYKRAIQLNPDYVEAYFNLGNAYAAIDEKEKAIIAYKKAIEINPNYANAYYNLSLIYFRKSEYDLAIKYCDKAVELGAKIHAEFLEHLKPFREN